jgi:riboflavin kinase/FMN adenylyltransferase
MLHRGHRKLVETARQLAFRRQVPMAIMSCDPHPREFFQPSSAFQRIGTPESSALAFAREGFDLLFRPRFDITFASMTADRFMEGVLHEWLDVSAVVCGSGFRFGTGRAGRVSDLNNFGRRFGVEVAVCSEVAGPDDRAVSSSRVRSAILGGDLETVGTLLGCHWYTSAIHSDRQISFADRQVLPPSGMYRVRLLDLDGHHVCDATLELGDNRQGRIPNAPPLPVGSHIVVWLGHARH